MENLVKVSVIVPVYKTEAYLRKCIDSLLAQTLKEFEVILVDDGSPDKCGAICDEYANSDSRIKVVHKINEGVSMARQTGVERAVGQYIIHVDSDDWVERDMLESLFIRAKETNADMVICDYYINYDHKQIYKCQKPSSMDNETIIKELITVFGGSCCNKLVKKSSIENNNVRFSKGKKLGEDLLNNIDLLVHGIKVAYLNKAYYHYNKRTNGKSLTMTCTTEDIVSLMEALKSRLSESLYYQCYPSLCYMLCNLALFNYSYSPKEYRKKFGNYVSYAFRDNLHSFTRRIIMLVAQYFPVQPFFKLLRKIVVPLKHKIRGY